MCCRAGPCAMAQFLVITIINRVIYVKSNKLVFLFYAFPTEYKPHTVLCCFPSLGILKLHLLNTSLFHTYSFFWHVLLDSWFFWVNSWFLIIIKYLPFLGLSGLFSFWGFLLLHKQSLKVPSCENRCIFRRQERGKKKNGFKQYSSFQCGFWWAIWGKKYFVLAHYLKYCLSRL